MLDPEVVADLLSGAGESRPLERLTPREHEVLALMAEGRSNAAIAARLFVSEKAVGKHTNSIFTKLDLPIAPDDNRRVLAVLAWLQRADPSVSRLVACAPCTSTTGRVLAALARPRLRRVSAI